MILNPGEKIHAIHRRHLAHEPQRHFIGVVEACESGVARVTGHVWVVDSTKFCFIRRPELRTRIISLVSGDVLLNVIPASVNLEKVVYLQEPKSVRVTDGGDWHLDLSELTWQ